ncbi:amino acid permease [Natrinema sp. 1APR25-10V2]|uniref:amino acid permease n=1 Tax=Natrinema sp. 1APR25-10V2 TaxID=2951081 RepID=UPI002875801A|nr:amino acid permease [Natrinema sp. 1APR25-10V2]MDS0476798.1 amino acid permease [Natrinema sp. 1APR25-10V2]
MPKELERDLGLFAVVAISIGAMIGSGIFILPGLALKTAGPAVILAYLLAGVLVVPAALSKAEMATAMPEAGGTYIFIERGMGPLLGTIAGVGTWFSLSFKGALALVGGVPYLLYLFDLPVKPVALALATVLVLVNIVGAKQTGRLQIAIVAVMLAAMVWFVVGGFPSTSSGRYGEFFAKGADGLLAATGLVFVSYAGVTKVASVAEEVENPDRNIPLGILGSLLFTTLLYVLIVVVMVGVTPPELLSDSSVPMIHAAEATLAWPGVVAVIIAAVLALISTANAGILSSSRYPFAMARDDLAPPSLTAIHEKWGTPVQAITLTGAVMLLLIAFVPILQIAKLASAFQIVVFALVNGAVIAFREGDAEEYNPSFTSPLYPWMQLAGIAGGFLLIGYMGTIPLVGAAVITAGSMLWYAYYARNRVQREGAATDVVRRTVGRKAVEQTKSIFDASDGYEVLVAITEETSERREQTLLRIAADIARENDGSVTVVQFDEVPDQVSLRQASETKSPADIKFEEWTEHLTKEFDVPVAYGEIVSHDAKRAIVNFADHEGADFLLLERSDEPLYAPIFGTTVEWITRNAPCDVLLVEDRDVEQIDSVTVVTDRGPFDPQKITVANALASEAGGHIDLVYPLGTTATATQRGTVNEYLAELESLCSVPVNRSIIETNDPERDFVSVTTADEILVIGTDGGRIRGNLFGRPADRIIDGVDCTAVQVKSKQNKSGLLRQLVERLVF